MYTIYKSIDAFDNALLKSTLHDILNGKSVDVPQYDFKTNSRLAIHHPSPIFARLENSNHTMTFLAGKKKDCQNPYGYRKLTSSYLKAS